MFCGPREGIGAEEAGFTGQGPICLCTCPLLRCRVAALLGRWGTWRFMRYLPEELPPCPASPLMLWRAALESTMAQGRWARGARRDSHNCSRRSLLSSTGWTSAERTKCCGKRALARQCGAGGKERAGGAFQILYLKKKKKIPVKNIMAVSLPGQRHRLCPRPRLQEGSAEAVLLPPRQHSAGLGPQLS